MRSRTGTPVTSWPSTSTRPALGRSSPAITRISEVLPDWVAPSRMVTAPATGASVIG
ncbi:hypothetical protein D9M68_951400 [compost metagenome]